MQAMPGEGDRETQGEEVVSRRFLRGEEEDLMSDSCSFLKSQGGVSVKTRYIIITEEMPETFWGGVKVLNSFGAFHNFQFMF